MNELTNIPNNMPKTAKKSNSWEDLARINAKYGGKGRKDLGNVQYAKELRQLFLKPGALHPTVDTEMKYWFAGIIEGEGSMNISLKKAENAKFGLLIDPEFSITQSSLSAEVILTALDIFKTGRVSWKQGSESTLVYRIGSREKLLKEVCPFYEKYCIKYGSATKNKRYELFKQFLLLMEQKKHTDLESFCSELLPIWSELRVHLSSKTSFLTLKDAQDYATVTSLKTSLNKKIQQKGSSET